MKTEIQPQYSQTTITCACGNVLEVGSTKKDLKVDVCSKCHPYWTGNLRQETAGGRADKFKKKHEAEFDVQEDFFTGVNCFCALFNSLFF